MNQQDSLNSNEILGLGPGMVNYIPDSVHQVSKKRHNNKHPFV